MPFNDTKAGQTHYYGDGCKEHGKRDLGTYFVKVVFEDGDGFIYEWNTGGRPKDTGSMSQDHYKHWFNHIS